MLELYKFADNSDESSSSPSEMKTDQNCSKVTSFHHSDSDDLSLSAAEARAQTNVSRLRHAIRGLFRGLYISPCL